MAFTMEHFETPESDSVIEKIGHELRLMLDIDSLIEIDGFNTIRELITFRFGNSSIHITIPSETLWELEIKIRDYRHKWIERLKAMDEV